MLPRKVALRIGKKELGFLRHLMKAGCEDFGAIRCQAPFGGVNPVIAGIGSL